MAMFFDSKYENRPYTGIERQPDLGAAPQFRYSPDDFSGGIFGALKGLTEGMAERGKEDRETKQKKEEFAAKMKAEAEQKELDRKEKAADREAEYKEKRDFFKYQQDTKKYAPSRGGGGGKKSGGGGDDGGGSDPSVYLKLGDNTKYGDQKVAVGFADEKNPDFYPTGRNPKTGDVIKTKKTKIPSVMTPQEIAPESEEEKIKQRLTEADRLTKMGDHAGAYFKAHEANPTKKRASDAYSKFRSMGAKALNDDEKNELAAVYISMDKTAGETGNDKDMRKMAAKIRNSLTPFAFEAKKAEKAATADPLDREIKQLTLEEKKRNLAYGDEKIAEEKEKRIASLEMKKAESQRKIEAEKAKGSNNWIKEETNNSVVEAEEQKIRTIDDKIAAARSGSSSSSKKKIMKSQHDSLRAEAEARGPEYLKQFDDKVKSNFEVVAD